MGHTIAPIVRQFVVKIWILINCNIFYFFYCNENYLVTNPGKKLTSLTGQEASYSRDSFANIKIRNLRKTAKLFVEVADVSFWAGDVDNLIDTYTL